MIMIILMKCENEFKKKGLDLDVGIHDDLLSPSVN